MAASNANSLRGEEFVARRTHHTDYGDFHVRGEGNVPIIRRSVNPRVR